MIGQYPAICLIRDLCSFFSSSAPSSISISVVLGARIHAHFFLGLFPPCFPVTARCLYPLSAMGHERARESRPRISRVAPRVRAIKGKTTIVIRINQRGLGGATDPREESRANTSQSSSFRPISYVPVSACDFVSQRDFQRISKQRPHSDDLNCRILAAFFSARRRNSRLFPVREAFERETMLYKYSAAISRRNNGYVSECCRKNEFERKGVKAGARRGFA